MPHHRQRLCENLIQKELSHIPCVGILGMRQVGKSTLIKKFCQTYYSFDSQDLNLRFIQNPSLLRTGALPIGVDEIQKVPSAFDEIKFDIDAKKRPGKYIISGSVRFSSKKQIRESLTGRISLIEVFPLTIAECHEKVASTMIATLLNQTPAHWENSLKKKVHFTQEQLDHYLTCGGVPGICFKRDESNRLGQFENHLETLLSRDIHMIYETQITYTKARLVLVELAKNQGLPVNMSHLSRIAQISQPTIKKLLLALEGIFLIRPHGNTYYLEDVGLAHYLNPNATHFKRSGDWLHMLFHEWRVQLAYGLRHQASLEQYTTRAGSEIPFVIRGRNGKTLAITLDLDEAASSKNQKALNWFLKKNKNANGVIFTFNKSAQQLSENIFSLPIHWAF